MSDISTFLTTPFVEGDAYFLLPVTTIAEGPFQFPEANLSSTLPSQTITFPADGVHVFPGNVSVVQVQSVAQSLANETVPSSTTSFLPGDVFVTTNSASGPTQASVPTKRQDRNPAVDESHELERHDIPGNIMSFISQVTETRYMCDTCGFEAESRSLVDEHIKQWNNDRHYRCEICEQLFNSFETFTSHEKQCRLSKTYRCDCGEMFNREINYFIHSATHDLSGKELRCPICQETFRRVASFRCHLKLHAVDDVVTCVHCEEEFSTSEELRHHLRTEHAFAKQTTPVHICKQCGATFKRPLELAEHMITHKKIKESLKTSYRRNKKAAKGSSGRYECKTCSKSFTKKSTLDRHALIHTGEKPFVCKVCDKSFNQKGSLMFHEAKHLPEKPHTCLLCGAGFSQRGNLRTHVKRVHPATATGSEKMWECPLCSCSLKSWQSLQVHMSKRHVDYLGSGSAKSNQDAGGETSKPNSTSHSIALESNQETTSTVDGQVVQAKTNGKKRKFVCSVCSKSFSKSTDLQRHIRSHTGERPFGCELCPQKFALRSTLEKHVRSRHLRLKAARCYICWKELANSNSLAAHLRIHNRTLVACDQCPAKFSTEARYQAHAKKVHQVNGKAIGQRRSAATLQQPLVETAPGVVQSLEKRGTGTSDQCRPHACSYCPARFKQRLHLVEHTRSHENSRPYVCQIGTCRRAFFTASALRDHLLIHSGVRRHICGVCKKAFLTRRSLTRHMVVHSDPSVRPFICPYCGKRFKRGVLCRRHMKLHLDAGQNDGQLSQPAASLAQESQDDEQILEPRFLEKPVKEMDWTAAPVDTPTMFGTNFGNSLVSGIGNDANVAVSVSSNEPCESNGNAFLAENRSPISSFFACWDPSSQNSTPTIPRFNSDPALLPPPASALHTPDNIGMDIATQMETSAAGFSINRPVFLCESCPSLTFDDEVQLDAHSRIVHQPCGPGYSGQSHPVFNELLSEPVQFAKTHSSDVTPAPLRRWSANRLSPTYLCPACGEKFSQVVQLTRHVYNFHPNSTATPSNYKEHDQPAFLTGIVTQHIDVASKEPTSGTEYEQVTSSGIGALVLDGVEHDWDSGDRSYDRMNTSGQQLHSGANAAASRNVRICPCCGKGFKKPSDLVRHIRVHTDERPFKCECGRAFRVKFALASHKLTHANRSTMHRCQVCNKMMASFGALKVHLRLHTNEKSYNCSQCNQEFPTASQLKQHLKSHRHFPQPGSELAKESAKSLNSAESSAFTQVVSSRGTLTDDDRLGLSFSYIGNDAVQLNVSRVFGSELPADVHAVVEIGYLRHLCEQRLSLSIPFPYGSASENISLDPSAIYELGVQESLEQMDEPSVADQQCFANTTTCEPPPTPSTYLVPASTGNEHQVQDTAAVPTAKSGATAERTSFIVECKICDLKFSNVHESIAHFQSPEHETAASIQQTSGPSHMCDTCGKLFATKMRLVRHIRSHSGEKPFQCSVCGECFSQKNCLKKHHLSKHTDEKPFPCLTCGRRFALKYNMETHARRIHGQSKTADNAKVVAVDKHSKQRVRAYLLSL